MKEYKIVTGYFILTEEEINKLAKEGWELVQAILNPPSCIVIFKRKIKK